MREKFDNQIGELRTLVLDMGNMVEDIISKSLTALINKDIKLADEIISLDDQVDVMEMNIENKCLNLIALQQPRAKDLRCISTALKIITDLERIGDYGVNIAKIIKEIGSDEFIKPLVDIPKMGNIATKMIRGCLDSYIKESKEQAVETALMDDEMDRLYNYIYVELLDMLSNDKRIIKQTTELLFIGRYLERIGDHITNICERIIYMINGERVKY